jgi:hypothetical protein
VPNNPDAQDFINGAAAVVKTPSKLWSKLKTLRKYSLLGPMMPHAHLGRIAMFHMGRSGSTVVARLLDQHPKIYWGHEIYYPIFKPYRKAITPDMHFDVDPQALLEKSSRWAGRRYFGFEVKFWHLERTGLTLPAYLDILKAFGVDRYIILERKNYLRRIASSRIGMTYDRMELQRSAATSLHTVELPLRYHVEAAGEVSMIEYFQDQEARFAQLRSLLKDEPVLDLSSSDDVFPDPVQAYRRICDFIGIEPVAVEVRTRRVNPYPLKETISNFEEVEQLLQDTPFEWMLYTDD